MFFANLIERRIREHGDLRQPDNKTGFWGVQLGSRLHENIKIVLRECSDYSFMTGVPQLENRCLEKRRFCPNYSDDVQGSRLDNHPTKPTHCVARSGLPESTFPSRRLIGS